MKRPRGHVPLKDLCGPNAGAALAEAAREAAEDQGLIKKKHRIWIELERGSHEERQERCKLVNAMLKRLGVKFDAFWSHKDQGYCVNLGPGGAGYLVCTDSGHWFDLEWLATGGKHGRR